MTKIVLKSYYIISSVSQFIDNNDLTEYAYIFIKLHVNFGRVAQNIAIPQLRWNSMGNPMDSFNAVLGPLFKNPPITNMNNYNLFLVTYF